MLDAVEEYGDHYLVMEYVSGGDLASVLSEGQMALETVLKLAIDLADALTRAHKLNIIHRDLKPANVLIGEDGTLRLTDFGVAHIGSKLRMTETDTIVGTLAYLPPEAFSGGIIDVRADIWAFGVIEYENAIQTTLHVLRSSSPEMIMARLSSLPIFAAFLAQKGSNILAAELLGLWRNHPAVPSAEFRASTQLQLDVKAAIGAIEYDAVWERGKLLDLETVVQELMAEFSDKPQA